MNQRKIRFHLNQRWKNAETPGGSIGLDETRSATARGGSSAAPGKRSIFPERLLRFTHTFHLNIPGIIRL